MRKSAWKRGAPQPRKPRGTPSPLNLYSACTSAISTPGAKRHALHTARRAYAAIADGLALPLGKRTGKFARAHIANLLGCLPSVTIASRTNKARRSAVAEWSPFTRQYSRFVGEFVVSLAFSAFKRFWISR